MMPNYLAQEAIDAAEQGDLPLVHELLDMPLRAGDPRHGRALRDRSRTPRPCSPYAELAVGDDAEPQRGL